jgi:ribonuclease P protein component
VGEAGSGPRRRRLSKSGDFDRVYREGVSSGNRFLVVYSFGGADAGRDGDRRLGISVGHHRGAALLSGGQGAANQ